MAKTLRALSALGLFLAGAATALTVLAPRESRRADHGPDAPATLERAVAPTEPQQPPAEADRLAAATGHATDGFGPALGDATQGRMPGEFEHLDALLIGVNELIEFHPETLVQIVEALDGDTDIVALVTGPDQQRRTIDLLRSRGLTTDHMVFFTWPTDCMWVQDFGPQQVVGDEVRIVDFEYALPGRETANQLPMAFAATFGMKIDHCHLAMEGGSLLSNGRGLCVSSTQIIEQNKDRGFDIAAIGRALSADFGFTKWVYLRPLEGESTGHLDLFLALGGPATVFLASYAPTEDRANAERMDDNALMLADAVTVDGRPPEIIRIRQPAAHDGCWRSYTNVIFGNGVVIVPQFPDACPDLDREALEVYRRAFPDRRVVGIDISDIVKKRGGLHCLSLTIPRLARASVSQR